MINVNIQARRMAVEDYDQIAGLVHYESNHHRHLDWRPPLERIDASNCWVLHEDGRINAVLVCPEDPPHVAWISFFGHHHNLQAVEAWPALWEMARAEIADSGFQISVAAIVTKSWFYSVLLSSGFEVKQNIILLELFQENMRLFSTPPEIRIRPMTGADIAEVTRLDRAAFGEFWHNSEGTLQRARLQSASATVAEDASGAILGYQLSTKNLLGAHLARLGVRLDAQGRGVGSALVSGMIRSFGGSRLNRLSVNTQSDNEASLALYKKLGFTRTGESFPVLVYPLGAI